MLLTRNNTSGYTLSSGNGLLSAIVQLSDTGSECAPASSSTRVVSVSDGKWQGSGSVICPPTEALTERPVRIFDSGFIVMRSYYGISGNSYVRTLSGNSLQTYTELQRIPVAAGPGEFDVSVSKDSLAMAVSINNEQGNGALLYSRSDTSTSFNATRISSYLVGRAS